MFNTLLICSGICWTAAYLLIIRQGFRDKTYGMPLPALAANLSWEFIFTVVHPHGFPQLAVNAVWLTCDLIIAWQALRYGPREWNWSRGPFLGVFAGSLVTGFLLVLLITYEFASMDKMSGAYAAFGQNLMMSILFVTWLKERGARGQSLAIAVSKGLGTVFASLGFLLYTSLGQSPLMLFLFAAIAIADGKYVWLLREAIKGLKLSPAECQCACCQRHARESSIPDQDASSPLPAFAQGTR